MQKLLESIILFVQETYIGAFLMLTVIFIIFMIIREHRNTDVFNFVSRGRMILIIRKSGTIYDYNDNFKVYFPWVKRGMRFSDLRDMYHELKDYQYGKDFIIDVNGKSFIVESEIGEDKIEKLVFVDWSKVVNSVPQYIMSKYDTGDYQKLRIISDYQGNILACPFRLKKYWWIFNRDQAITKLEHLGLHANEVERMIKNTINGTYLNDLLISSFDNKPVFVVSAHVVEDGQIAVDLDFISVPVNKYHQEYEEMKAVFDSVSDGVITVNLMGDVLAVNKKMRTFFGSAVGVGTNISNSVFLHDQANRPVEFVFPMGDTHYPFVWLSSADASYRFVTEVKINELYNDVGVKFGHVIVIRDTSNQESRVFEVNNLIYRDALTQLYNRRFLSDRVLTMNGTKMQRLAIIMIDCNGLKLLNDTFGHNIGDELLKLAADHILSHISIHDSVIRIGGDEFVVVLYDYAISSVEKIVADIREGAPAKYVGPVPLSLAVGFSYHGSGRVDVNRLINQAEEMMYNEKVGMSKATHNMIFEAMLRELFKRKPWEKEHAHFVSRYSALTARHMGLSDETVNLVRDAGLYHNIGKIGLPVEILNKGYRSSKDKSEFDRHPEIAYRVLSAMPEYSELAKSVLYYKERFDGTGIPHNLKGDQIPIASRIIAVVSHYHAMVDPDIANSYRYGHDEAIAKLVQKSGSYFDPEAVESFITIISVEKGN